MEHQKVEYYFDFRVDFEGQGGFICDEWDYEPYMEYEEPDVIRFYISVDEREMKELTSDEVDWPLVIPTHFGVIDFQDDIPSPQKALVLYFRQENEDENPLSFKNLWKRTHNGSLDGFTGYSVLGQINYEELENLLKYIDKLRLPQPKKPYIDEWNKRYDPSCTCGW